MYVCILRDGLSVIVYATMSPVKITSYYRCTRDGVHCLLVHWYAQININTNAIDRLEWEQYSTYCEEGVGAVLMASNSRDRRRR